MAADQLFAELLLAEAAEQPEAEAIVPKTEKADEPPDRVWETCAKRLKKMKLPKP